MVAARLEAQAVAHYLPLLTKARLHHGSRVITLRPMIPGYIFLCVDDDQRSELKRVERNFIQIELLRDAYSESLLIQELNALHQCELLAQTEPVLVNPGIQRGDQVLITSGPLAGLLTNVVRRDDRNHVIIVNISILDVRVEYPVESELLVKITA